MRSDPEPAVGDPDARLARFGCLVAAGLGMLILAGVFSLGRSRGWW